MRRGNIVNSRNFTLFFSQLFSPIFSFLPPDIFWLTLCPLTSLPRAFPSIRPESRWHPTPSISRPTPPPSLLPSHPSLWLSLFGLLACRVTKLFFFFVHLLSLVFVFNKVIFTTRTPHRASPWRLLSGAPSFLARAREAASLSSFSLCLIPCC